MNECFATVARGLEAVAAQELERLGASKIEPEFTGVRFWGDRSVLYRVNLWARIPFRILVKLQEFPCRDVKSLYRGVQRIDWSRYLQPHNTLVVTATGGNKKLNHTHFTALQVKDAIVAQQQRRLGQRSSIDLQNPDLLINVHIAEEHCVLSLDSTGESLHRRGYRSAAGCAPIKENLAAALIEMTGWEPTWPFLDPLCGSGTFPIEASLKGLNIAPGLLRQQFAFEQWPDFDPELWTRLREDAQASQRSELQAPVIGSDRNAWVLKQAQINAENCGVASQVVFMSKDLAQIEAPADRGVILCNPPYGERLGEVQQLSDLYKLLGDTFKQRFKGWTAFVLSGNPQLTKCIGLRTAQRIPVYNGAIECRLLKYELY